MGDVCRVVLGVVFLGFTGVFFLTLHLYLAPLLYPKTTRLQPSDLGGRERRRIPLIIALARDRLARVFTEVYPS
jgi:hypothetical protein